MFGNLHLRASVWGRTLPIDTLTSPHLLVRAQPWENSAISFKVSHFHYDRRRRAVVCVYSAVLKALSVTATWAQPTTASAAGGVCAGPCLGSLQRAHLSHCTVRVKSLGLPRKTFHHAHCLSSGSEMFQAHARVLTRGLLTPLSSCVSGPVLLDLGSKGARSTIIIGLIAMLPPDGE